MKKTRRQKREQRRNRATTAPKPLENPACCPGTKEYRCPRCNSCWCRHDLMSRRPPRWLCPDGAAVMWTVAHTLETVDEDSPSAKIPCWDRRLFPPENK